MLAEIDALKKLKSTKIQDLRDKTYELNAEGERIATKKADHNVKEMERLKKLKTEFSDKVKKATEEHAVEESKLSTAYDGVDKTFIETVI